MNKEKWSLYSVYIINIFGNTHNTKWHEKKMTIHDNSNENILYIFPFQLPCKKTSQQIRQWTYVSVKQKHNANNIKY